MRAAERVAAYGADDPLDRLTKGLPPAGPGAARTLADLATGWQVLSATASTPVALLRAAALDGNIATMARYCQERRLSLAPHAKTTMSPQIVSAQLAAGAWAMTAALPSQVERLWEFGVPRVLLAHEVADPAALARLVETRASAPDRELLCFVDSTTGVAMAEAAASRAGPAAAGPLPVLVDVGYAGGRTGTRTRSDLLAVAEAAAAAPHLRLAGVGGYEGTLGSKRDSATLAKVDSYLATLGDAAVELGERALYDPTADPVVTAGGSVWFDRVAALLGPLAFAGTARVVLRSGCYVTHDHGIYERGSPSAEPGWDLSPFRPALEVWARVVSRPEPGLALLDAGRRDLSHDAGMPRPLAARTPAGNLVPLGAASVPTLSDQHTFVSLPPECELAVGDLVGLGVSHPCTTLDRWPLLLVVDESYEVVGAARTYL